MRTALVPDGGPGFVKSEEASAHPFDVSNSPSAAILHSFSTASLGASWQGEIFCDSFGCSVCSVLDCPQRSVATPSIVARMIVFTFIYLTSHKGRRAPIEA